ncbi:MAG: DUF5808 domain-containing protein [Clostridium sp.]
MLFYLLLVLLPAVLMLFTSYKNISFGDKTLLFGVRLPVNFNKGENIDKIIKDYKKTNIISSILLVVVATIAMFFIPEEFVITIGILSIVYMSLTIYISFYKAHNKVKAIKIDEKWDGYTKNVVIVDLNNKKNIKGYKGALALFLAPILVIVATLGIMIHSYNALKNTIVQSGGLKTFGEVVPLHEYLFPVYMQIILLVILTLSGLMILKSKQIINGGEVEKIKSLNIRLKKINLFFLAIMTTIVEVIFMIIALSKGSAPTVTVLIAVAVMFAVVIILTIYYERTIKQHKEVSSEENIVNKDDDRFYIAGMFYSNPGDPSIIVPKRVGTGSDFNYGHKKVKIPAAIFGVIISIVLGFTAFYLPFDMGEKSPVIDNKVIKISGIYGEDINRDNIASVTLENIPDKVVKTNGAALETKLYGNFKINGIINSKMYVSNTRIPAVKILLNDGRVIYINHNGEKGTMEVYTLISSFIK